MEFIESLFSIKTIMVHIPLGKGYDLSYIEAVGTIFGLLCIWLASREKIINYFFGLVNVTLFCILFFQIQLYANMMLQLFFFAANVYGWYAWSRQTEEHEHTLKIRWMSFNKQLITVIISIVSIILLALYIDPFFFGLSKIAVHILNGIGINGLNNTFIPDPYPWLDATVTVLSIVAMILMTRKYVESWILWFVIDVLSIILYSSQGVYFMSLEYAILTFIAACGTINWIKSAKEK